MKDLLTQVKAARLVSTPIVAIKTSNPATTQAAICGAYPNGKIPKVTWDVVAGCRPLNDLGQKALTEINPTGDPLSLCNPVDMLAAAAKLPAESILFFQNAQRFVGQTAPDATICLQALWNLRDPFKSNRRMIVLLVPDIQLPPEIANDVFVIDEPLPTPEELEAIVHENLDAAGLTKVVKADQVAAAVDAVRGLAAFPTEQVVAMSLTPDGIDIPSLWERKRQRINSQDGLSVWTGGETFDDLGGLSQIKQYGLRLIGGRKPIRSVVFIDEIEKMLAGSTTGTGDSSGVSQGMLQQLLVFMQDTEAMGIILVGPPGTGKSAVAKSIGNAAKVLTIALDVNGMKGSLVGESEQKLRDALKVVSAVSDNATLFVATCNGITQLPPELRRRFTLGVYFVDLPDATEREAIWPIYLKKYELQQKAERPDDSRWTGAEIKQACFLAWNLGIPLKETAQYITPVAITAQGTINELRTLAHERFLSASYKGFYKHAERAAEATTTPLAEKFRRKLAE